jgi:hypothetical protein
LPSFEDPLTANKAALKDLREQLASQRLESVCALMDGGGVCIANAESAEELCGTLTSYPLSPMLEYHVEPVADIIKLLEGLIEGG